MRAEKDQRRPGAPRAAAAVVLSAVLPTIHQDFFGFCCATLLVAHVAYDRYSNSYRACRLLTNPRFRSSNGSCCARGGGKGCTCSCWRPRYISWRCSSSAHLHDRRAALRQGSRVCDRCVVCVHGCVVVQGCVCVRVLRSAFCDACVCACHRACV